MNLKHSTKVQPVFFPALHFNRCSLKLWSPCVILVRLSSCVFRYVAPKVTVIFTVYLWSVVKPKPMQSLWPITGDADSPVNQSEFEVFTCNRRQARENARCNLRLVLLLIGWKRWHEFRQPIAARSQAKLKQTRITFNGQLKTAPSTYYLCRRVSWPSESPLRQRFEGKENGRVIQTWTW